MTVRLGVPAVAYLMCVLMDDCSASGRRLLIQSISVERLKGSGSDAAASASSSPIVRSPAASSGRHAPT
jgi:hypothetical protein